MTTNQRSQSWWDQGAAAIQSRVTASRPGTKVATNNPTTKTTKQTNNSSGVNSGNQFVTTRDGSDKYSPVPFEQYAGSMGNAFNQTTDATGRILNKIASLSSKDPRTEASAYSTKRTADAAFLQAEAALEQAKSNSRSNGSYAPTTRDRLFNPEFQSPMSYENKARDGMNRFKPQFEFANNKANRQAQMDLNKMLASSRLDEARINANAGIEQTRTNADAQVREARIRQPLSSGQVLEQTRIQTPDPMRGMAMNMLGNYTNQGARSNFAYWG